MKKQPASLPNLTIDEIKSRQLTGRLPCSLNEFVSTHLTKPELAVLADALRDRGLQVSAIFRSLEARGFHRGELVVRRHREHVCIDCRAWLRDGTP